MPLAFRKASSVFTLPHGRGSDWRGLASGSALSNPAQLNTGNRGYFGNRASVADSLHM